MFSSFHRRAQRRAGCDRARALLVMVPMRVMVGVVMGMVAAVVVGVMAAVRAVVRFLGVLAMVMVVVMVSSVVRVMGGMMMVVAFLGVLVAMVMVPVVAGGGSHRAAGVGPVRAGATGVAGAATAATSAPAGNDRGGGRRRGVDNGGRGWLGIVDDFRQVTEVLELGGGCLSGCLRVLAGIVGPGARGAGSIVDTEGRPFGARRRCEE